MHDMFSCVAVLKEIQTFSSTGLFPQRSLERIQQLQGPRDSCLNPGPPLLLHRVSFAHDQLWALLHPWPGVFSLASQSFLTKIPLLKKQSVMAGCDVLLKLLGLHLCIKQNAIIVEHSLPTRQDEWQVGLHIFSSF